jgi:hypothetical protein
MADVEWWNGGFEADRAIGRGRVSFFFIRFIPRSGGLKGGFPIS